MKQIKDGLLELSKQEQARSMLTYGLFNSNHEAYAVLKEELEEMADAAEPVNRLFAFAWNNVKNNCLSPDDLRALHENVLHMGGELIQALAMISKWLVLFEDPRVDKEPDTN